MLCFAFMVGVLTWRTTVLYAALNAGDWTGWRHHLLNVTAVPVMGMIQEPIPPCSSGHHRAMGCCVTRLGPCTLWDGARQGSYSLLFQGNSAPTSCRIRLAESGSYRKRLKYHQCPIDNNEAVFFQLLSNGHLHCFTVACNTDQHHYR